MERVQATFPSPITELRTARGARLELNRASQAQHVDLYQFTERLNFIFNGIGIDLCWCESIYVCVLVMETFLYVVLVGLIMDMESIR